MSLANALAQLRHLYAQMIDPATNRNPASAAKGLLGPAIVELERAARAESEGTREDIARILEAADEFPAAAIVRALTSPADLGATASRDGQGETPTCRAGLPDGRRCSFHAVPGSMFCWSHGGPDEGTGGTK